jgi:uncharacterized protein YlxW (UPF0749 family)
MLATFVAVTTMAALVACGVPNAEHDKVVNELNKAKQENMALTDQLVKEKEATQQHVAQLQSQIDGLKKENAALKAKSAPKKAAAKPAAKPAAKAPAVKK